MAESRSYDPSGTETRAAQAYLDEQFLGALAAQNAPQAVSSTSTSEGYAPPSEREYDNDIDMLIATYG